jgi:signal transduction histidine kinase
VVAAIANVVKNAIEAYATGPSGFWKGKVTVSARTADADRIEMVIADEGCGIQPTDLAEISRFVPGKTTKKNQGTGFGLAIAKRNILAHGGDLSIASQEGEGTVVTISLPLEQDQGDAP